MHLRIIQKLRTLSLLILLAGQSTFVFTQSIAEDISPKQVQNAQSQARFLIESFGEFLQIIAQSEDGGEVSSMIQMVVEDGQLSKRLFTGKEVLIVSDIDPRVVDEESTVGEGFVEVETYLADFDAFYTKSDPNGISIDNILVSAVKRSKLSGDLYLKVRFNSKFEGRHKDIRKAYSQTNRMARVKIVEGEQWAYYIDLISFFPQGDTTRYYEVETRDQIKSRYRNQLARAQRLWAIYDYDAALTNYILSNQIFTVDSIREKIDLIEEIIDDRDDRKYYSLDGYNRKIGDEPNDPNLYYERGLKNLEENKVKAASDDFLMALELSDRQYKLAWIALADLWEKEDGINGIEYLEQALLLDPGDIFTLKRLISLQVESGLWTDAKKNLMKVEELENDADMLLKLGVVNQNLDQHRDASLNFQKLIKLNPDFALAHFELGRSHLNLSEFEPSMESFLKANELDALNYPKSNLANIYLDKARQYREEEKSILALSAVEQALILLPKMPEAITFRNSLNGKEEEVRVNRSEERKEGDLFFMEGNYKEALKAYKILKKKKIGSEQEITLKIAECYLAMEDYNRALISANEILFVDGSVTKAQLFKARALSGQGNNKPALNILDRLLDQKKEELGALKLKSRILLEQKDYLAASLSLNRLESVLNQRGELPSLEFRKVKAQVFLGQENYQEALDEIDEVLQVENFNADFLYFKAFALYGMASYEESITFAEASLEQNAANEEALILKIKSYIEKGSPQLALSSIDELQGVNKDIFTLAYYKALANFKLGDIKSARSWVDRAVRAKRNDFQAQLLSGRIMLAQERYLDAGMALNAAYKLNPDNAEANFELGKYYHYFGSRQTEDKRLEDAMPFYNRALELDPELFNSFPEILAKINK
ncbi:MAG: tetratricopeptide repeat protein [Bacteroidia bacterium]|nr:tetratricopeptide repeat protein [Bacteroidia bacterium]